LSLVSEEALRSSVEEALKLGKKRNFKESIDLIVVLRDVDIRSPEGRLREVVVLPHKPNKDVKVCVVAEGDMALKAKELGLTVYTRSDLQAMRGNKKAARKVAESCDWVLVRADLMGLAGGTLGPALGPRGKAPIPVPPNADIAQLAERYSRSVWVRVRNQPQVMCRVGTQDMKVEEIVENIKAVLTAIVNKLGPQKIGRVLIKRTMGVPVEVPLR
jgi:large subunit ribosomal protein L1